MVKKTFLSVVLFAFVFLGSGCVTICAEKVCVDGDAAQCGKKTTQVTAEEGPNMIEKADNWVKENLW